MSVVTQPNPKERPPYWLGLLCLIPLAGAFVGLALLLYGIFKYKDKWLIIAVADSLRLRIFHAYFKPVGAYSGILLLIHPRGGLLTIMKS